MFETFADDAQMVQSLLAVVVALAKDGMIEEEGGVCVCGCVCVCWVSLHAIMNFNYTTNRILRGLSDRIEGSSPDSNGNDITYL